MLSSDPGLQRRAWLDTTSIEPVEPEGVGLRRARAPRRNRRDQPPGRGTDAKAMSGKTRCNDEPFEPFDRGHDGKRIGRHIDRARPLVSNRDVGKLRKCVRQCGQTLFEAAPVWPGIEFTGAFEDGPAIIRP